jgi:hypothetical protein
MPKTLLKSVKVLNLREGISNNIQRVAVPETYHNVRKFFSV